jgi:hypothetical protein
MDSFTEISIFPHLMIMSQIQPVRMTDQRKWSIILPMFQPDQATFAAVLGFGLASWVMTNGL